MKKKIKNITNNTNVESKKNVYVVKSDSKHLQIDDIQKNIYKMEKKRLKKANKLLKLKNKSKFKFNIFDNICYSILKLIILIFGILTSIVIIFIMFVMFFGPINSLFIAKTSSQYVSQYLLPEDLEVKINNSTIYWDSVNKALAINLNNIELGNRSKIDIDSKIQLPDVAILITLQNIFYISDDDNVISFVLNDYNIDVDKIARLINILELNKITKQPWVLKEDIKADYLKDIDKIDKKKDVDLLDEKKHLGILNAFEKIILNKFKKEEIIDLKKTLRKYLYFLSRLYFNNVKFQFSIPSILDKTKSIPVSLDFSKVILQNNKKDKILELNTTISINDAEKSLLTLFLNTSTSNDMNVKTAENYDQYNKFHGYTTINNQSNFGGFIDFNNPNAILYMKITGASYQSLKNFNIDVFNNLDLLLDLWVKVIVNDDSTIKDIEFIISSDNGGIMQNNEYWTKSIEINNMELIGKYDYMKNILDVHNFHLSADKNLYLYGNYQHNFNNNIDIIKIFCDSIPIDDFYEYWPWKFGDKVKLWLRDNLTDGIIDSAYLKLFLNHNELNINKEDGDNVTDIDIDNEVNWQNKLISTINIRNAKFKYEYPQNNSHVVNIDRADINFKNDEMKANIIQANIHEADLNNFGVTISKITSPNPSINIVGDINANIKKSILLLIKHFYSKYNRLNINSKNFITFIKNDPGNKSLGEYLDFITNVDGDASSEITIDIPIHYKNKDVDKDEVSNSGDSNNKPSNNKVFQKKNSDDQSVAFKVSSSISDFKAIRVMSKYDIKSEAMKISYNGKVFNINGPININNKYNTNIVIEKEIPEFENIKFENKNSINLVKIFDKTPLNIKFISNNISLNDILFKNIEMRNIIDGYVDIIGDLKIVSNNKQKLSMDVDLTKSKITVDKLNILKEVGVSGNLHISSMLEDISEYFDKKNTEGVKNREDAKTLNSNISDNITMDYKFTIPTLDSSGVITYDPQNFNVSTLKSNNTVFRNNNFKIKYVANKDNVKEVNIDGQTLDMRFSESSMNDMKNFIHKRSTDLSNKLIINAKLNKILLNSDQILNDATFHGVCYDDYCDDLEFKGIWDKSGGYISIFYNYPVFAISSNSADKTLQAFNLYKNLRGGMLDVRMILDDKNPSKGTIEIDQFNLVNAPVFAELLKLFSLTSVQFFGLFDIFNLGGMRFETLYCDVLWDKDLVKFSNCEIKGRSLNIVTKGEINTKTKDVEFVGFLRQVQILDIFVNIAKHMIKKQDHAASTNDKTNFYIKGNSKNKIAVQINPLSLVAPGFLGYLFASQPKRNNESEDSITNTAKNTIQNTDENIGSTVENMKN